jgi:hypothetical protein
MWKRILAYRTQLSPTQKHDVSLQFASRHWTEVSSNLILGPLLPVKWRYYYPPVWASKHDDVAVNRQLHSPFHTEFWLSRSYISCNFTSIHNEVPITAAAWSKAWNLFVSSNAGIVCLTPTQGMDVCMYVHSVCVVLCVGSDLAAGWSPVQGVLPSV